MTVNYAQARTLHDDKHENYFDKLHQHMQEKRLAITTKPTLTKYNERGNINHEQPRKTTDPYNYHSQTLNHSSIPLNNRF